MPGFGPPRARLLLVGLAPGLHGANRSGRPFTGDHAGHLLYETLLALGLAQGVYAERIDDGLSLAGCRILNAVRCVPPQNKPLPAEVNTCNRFLAAGIRESGARVLLALGGVAHGAVLAALGIRRSRHRFAHGALHELETGHRLIDSYHCSRYNTNTGLLTPAMFHEALGLAKASAGL